MMDAVKATAILAFIAGINAAALPQLPPSVLGSAPAIPVAPRPIVPSAPVAPVVPVAPVAPVSPVVPPVPVLGGPLPPPIAPLIPGLPIPIFPSAPAPVVPPVPVVPISIPNFSTALPKLPVVDLPVLSAVSKPAVPSAIPSAIPSVIPPVSLPVPLSVSFPLIGSSAPAVSVSSGVLSTSPSVAAPSISTEVASPSVSDVSAPGTTVAASTAVPLPVAVPSKRPSFPFIPKHPPTLPHLPKNPSLPAPVSPELDPVVQVGNTVLQALLFILEKGKTLVPGLSPSEAAPALNFVNGVAADVPAPDVNVAFAHKKRQLSAVAAPSATPSAAAAGGLLGGLTGGLTGGLLGGSSPVGAVTNTVGGVTGGLTGGSSPVGAVTGALGGVTGGLTGGSSPVGAVTGTLGGLTGGSSPVGAVTGTLGGVTGGANPVGAVTGTLGNAVGGSVTGPLNGAVSTVANTAGSLPVVGGVTGGTAALGSVGSVANGALNTVGQVAGQVPVVGGAVQGVVSTAQNAVNSVPFLNPYPISNGIPNTDPVGGLSISIIATLLSLLKKDPLSLFGGLGGVGGLIKRDAPHLEDHLRIEKRQLAGLPSLSSNVAGVGVGGLPLSGVQGVSPDVAFLVGSIAKNIAIPGGKGLGSITGNILQILNGVVPNFLFQLPVVQDSVPTFGVLQLLSSINPTKFGSLGSLTNLATLSSAASSITAPDLAFLRTLPVSTDPSNLITTITTLSDNILSLPGNVANVKAAVAVLSLKNLGLSVAGF